MSYPGRSHERISTSGFIYQLLMSVEKGLSWEVSRGHSRNESTEGLNNLQVFKYAKII